MKKYKHILYFLIVLSLTFTKEGTGQCNPFQVNTPLGTTINNFDWTTETFDMYLAIDDQPSYRSIPSPFFYLFENDNIEHFVQQPLDVKDFYPEDGWEIIKVDFGTPIHGVVAPGLVLYNRYESVLRVFHFISQEAAGIAGQGFNKAAIELSFVHNQGLNNESAALNYITMPAKALDDFEKEINAKTPNTYNNGGYIWLWADFPVAYDPCTCNYFTKIQSEPRLYEVTQVDLNMEGGGTINQVVNNAASGGGTASNSFSSIIGKANGAVAKGAKASKTIEGYYNFLEGLEGLYTVKDKKTNYEAYEDLTPAEQKKYDKSKIKPFKFPEWTKSIPKVGYVIGIIDFLSGGEKEKSKPTPITMEAKLKFGITGTETLDSPFAGVDFFTPGSDWAGQTTNEPIYNNILGTFALLNTPKVEAARYRYEKEGEPEDSYYSRLTLSLEEPLSYAINPHTGLQLVDISARFVFELNISPGVDLPSLYSSEMTEISIEENKFYVSPFIPLSCFDEYLLKADLLKNPWLQGFYYEIKDIKIQFLLNLEKNMNDPFYIPEAKDGVALLLSHTTNWHSRHITEAEPNEAWPDESAFFLSNIDYDKKVDNINLTQDQTIYAWSTIEVGENIQTNGHQLTLIAGSEIIAQPGDLPQDTDLLLGHPPGCEAVQPQATLSEIKTFCKESTGKYNPKVSGNIKDEESDFGKSYVEKEGALGLSVSPNPVTNFLTIQYNLEQESTFHLFIQNAVGFEMYSYDSKQVVQGEHQQDVDFSSFPSGMYIISIITPSGRQSVKVIK